RHGPELGVDILSRLLLLDGTERHDGVVPGDVLPDGENRERVFRRVERLDDDGRRTRLQVDDVERHQTYSPAASTAWSYDTAPMPPSSSRAPMMWSSMMVSSPWCS